MKGLLLGMLLVVGTLYILNFTLKKPKDWMIFCLIGVVACAVMAVLLFSEYRISRRIVSEGPLIDEITEVCDE